RPPRRGSPHVIASLAEWWGEGRDLRSLALPPQFSQRGNHMGTSAPRRAPTTRWWRLAKGAATRYLSPEGAGGVEVREVVARYLAALEGSAAEGGKGALAAFRLTRKVAQDFGAFWAQAASQGWEAALDAWGLPELKGQPPQIAVQGLSAALAGPGGGLEEAVARAAVAVVCRQHLSSAGLSGPQTALSPWPEADRLVRQLLAAALSMRLVLDLGEPLEAAGRDFSHLQKGMKSLADWIDKAATDLPGLTPPEAEQWRGLTGWLWVTQVIEVLLENLSRHRNFGGY
ncbi:MAG: hypothetical protein Q8M54_05020, partial [Desulfobaccales bacterium]|nr:hypothetical protein [Desulfobaccales bacterium]